MSKKLFILGAGASMPFKFPSGKDLVEIILRIGELHKLSTTDRKRMINPRNGDGFRVQIESILERMDEANFPIQYTEDFFIRLKKSTMNSIDAFLEFNPQFIELGKFLIAHIILRYETEGGLFANIKNHWLNYLWSKISPLGVDNFPKHRIGFITYNYDRSLEYYLFNVIQNTYGLPDDETLKLFQTIPIVHVHGQLGFLPQLKTESHQFEINFNLSNPQNDDVYNILDDIKIIHENVDDSAEYQKAWKLIKDSQTIHFLGFGYHPTNLKRLAIMEQKQFSNIRIFGTGYGLTENEIRQIKLSGKNNSRMDIDNKNGDNLDFIRNKVDFSYLPI